MGPPALSTGAGRDDHGDRLRSDLDTRWAGRFEEDEVQDLWGNGRVRSGATIESEPFDVRWLMDELAGAAPWDRGEALACGLLVASAGEVDDEVFVGLVRRAREVVTAHALVHDPVPKRGQRTFALLLRSLAVAARRADRAGQRARAVLQAGLAFVPADQLALALVTLAADLILSVDPDSTEARTLLQRAAYRLHAPRLADPWLWPEPERDALDGSVPAAMMAAGHRLGSGGLVRNGLLLLDWRLAYPLGGDAGEGSVPEAVFLLDACLRAGSITGDESWRERGIDRAQRALARSLGRDGSAEVTDARPEVIDLRVPPALCRHLLELAVAEAMDREPVSLRPVPAAR